MSVAFQVIIYLILVFGIMMLCIAFCENSLNNKERYIRIKKEGMKVNLKLEIQGVDEKDKKLIANVIENGMFQNIYDIVDEYIICESIE